MHLRHQALNPYLDQFLKRIVVKWRIIILVLGELNDFLMGSLTDIFFNVTLLRQRLCKNRR